MEGGGGGERTKINQQHAEILQRSITDHVKRAIEKERACCLMVASAASTAFITWNKLSLLLLLLLLESLLFLLFNANPDNLSAKIPSWPFSISTPTYLHLSNSKPQFISQYNKPHDGCIFIDHNNIQKIIIT